MDYQQQPILLLNEINNYSKYKACISNEQEIDSGSFGIVYKAYVNQVMPIAVKKMKLSKNCEQEVQILAKENEFLMNLTHTNIVKVYFHFHYKNSKNTNYYYIGMEYVEQNLETYLNARLNNKLDENQVNDLAYQLQRGLSYLQKKITAHRDLKPANVLVSNEGVYKLCDFSEMKYQDFTIREMMTTIKGTKSYLAPELRIALDNQGKIVYNPVKADVFSYGLIVLQSLLTCKTITIDGLNQKEKDIKEMIQNNFSMGFKEFLKMCLSFNPEQRQNFTDMNEIFEVNHIENYYKIQKMQQNLDLMNNNNAKLENEKIQSQQMIENLLNQQSKLEIQLKQLQTGNQFLQKSQPQIKLQQQQIIQSNILTDEEKKLKEEKLKLIFDSNQKTWANNSTEKKQEQIRNNSGLTIARDQFTNSNQYYYQWDQYQWVQQSKWATNSKQQQYFAIQQLFEENNTFAYKFPYLSCEDGKYTCFIQEDMPKAVELIKQLSQETGIRTAVCLRMLHSNQWNYEKSKNDIMYC